MLTSSGTCFWLLKKVGEGKEVEKKEGRKRKRQREEEKERREGEKEGGKGRKRRKEREAGKEGRGILMSGWKALVHGYLYILKPDELSTTAAIIGKK